jgi:hypothetical protein
LEQIIRPFQLLDPTATIRVEVVLGQVPIQPAHLCWGAAGKLPKAVQQADNFNGVNFRVVECDHHLKEKKRQTEQLRIEQPGNPNNYVITERIRHIQFENTDKQQYDDVVQTDTLHLQLPDLFAGTGFGQVIKHDKCGQDMYLNR